MYVLYRALNLGVRQGQDPPPLIILYLKVIQASALTFQYESQVKFGDEIRVE